MSTIRVTLDLSADELADVISILEHDVQAIVVYTEVQKTTPEQRNRLNRRFRSAWIALRQLEAAGRDGVDGGPAGTARHIIR